MPRYKTDLHSIMKNGRLSRKHFLIVASQIIEVLMHLHSKHYVHSDIKAENIMIGLCKNALGQHDASKKSIEFSGANPVRRCRVKESNRANLHHTFYHDMVKSHYLRPGRNVTYAIDETSRSTHAPESDVESYNSEKDEDFELTPRKTKNHHSSNKAKGKKRLNKSQKKTTSVFASSLEDDTNDRVYVIDYGLATKFIDTNGEHKPFCMDQRRAHDGTLEFTSRDAHFGAHSRRSDLECLGYNLIYWSQGFLPWKDDKLKEQPEIVHRLKEVFMTDVKEIMKLLYGKDVPRYLGEFMQYVNQLEFDAKPDYSYLKGLFEKEFVKLGFKMSEMKLSLKEIREECQPIDKTMSENDQMMAAIVDLKSVKKLGFLIATDNVDGTEPLIKPKESISLNISSKSSPKNLRSKEKFEVKRSKRQPKMTVKEVINEKIAQGKKLSIAEIATLDPDKIARDRADREYEKFDDKVYYHTPQRYKGNPTYAILEIENKLKNKLNGSSIVQSNGDIEPIKGYTKPMMDVLKKQQMIVEQQITPISNHLQQKKNREGLRNVIKPTRKGLIFTNNTMVSKICRKRRQTCGKSNITNSVRTSETCETVPEEIEVSKVPVTPRKKATRRKRLQSPPILQKCGELLISVQEIEKPVKKKRGRPKTIRNVIEAPETEEDSVYYDIPGEGSNDGIKEISEDENEPEIVPYKRSRHTSPADESSNQGSVASDSTIHIKKQRYYADNDYDAATDETTNMSTSTVATKSTESLKPNRRNRKVSSHDNGITTRTKVKSRSTSRSAATFNEATDQSECSEALDNDSEYEIQSEDDSGEELEEQEQGREYDQSESDGDITSESELAEDSNDSDSIDFKYSPIKTRHARRRINNFNLKQIRGKVISTF